ncbi:phospholipase D family protein [Rhizobium brockwellii]|uniref:Phospholipase D n=1 Tax=Rhizobium brockwellii TaxID=3019932 RepID=A0ABU3YXE4_9HYPH|nr:MULTISPECIES: phospholipase D family protein [Rhizobium]MDV4183514.1 phospholipase D family protein [Rhizobium brockwellii]MDV4190525.1 phospholipase D family protein [Rhizobium brockwellii]TAX87283.1 phospholipase D family protein [Rhizobium leguminosarum]
MNLFSIAIIVVVAPAALSALAVSSYARFLKRVQKVESHVLKISPADTELDRYGSRLCQEREAASGLVLITSNLDAFAARLLAARSAGRSLDLMYYMWNADLTGMLIMREVVAAADRGVRVRILLDDLGVSMSDKIFHAIDRHPHIELRLFNPTKARESIVRRGVEMALRFRSVNRRMHNKAWIADGRIAIVGGRNIGDAYFDAGEEANFRDFDLVMVGKAVAKTESLFDEYWNSSVAVPVRALLSGRPNKLKKLRRNMDRLRFEQRAQPYLDRIRDGKSLKDAVAEDRYIWVDKLDVLADPPEKAGGKRRSGQNMLMETLLPVITGTAEFIHITSPYFIPGERGVEALTKLTGKGMTVSVLTNSLAATDVAAVHAGYSRYRPALLKGGVALYELKSIADTGSFSLRGSKQASLHTKAFARDGRHGFIGSLNLDPRSVSLNTEMGVLFESPHLVAQMDAIFAEETQTNLSYPVSLDKGSVRWLKVVDGKQTLLRGEPDAGFTRRATAWLIGWLPLESQL